VQVSVDARRLRDSWRVRLRRNQPLGPDLLFEIEECLARLEEAGREAFNVYPSHYEEPAPAVVREAVNELRSRGVTSGTRSGSTGPCIHFWIDPEPADH
jgi:hypothetical protein